MLVRFAVENYNSFKDRQVFSMVAGKHTRHPSHCITVKGTRLLKSSFFFGANASGKSNFVHAIDFMRRVVLHGTDSIKHTDRYFRISPEYKGRPGVFQADFIADGTTFSYGFAVNYLTHKILGEWLYRIDSPDKEVCIFERESEEKIFTNFPFSKKSRTRFDIYCEDLNENELLLNQIGNKKLESESDFHSFIEAFRWFQKLIVVYPNSHARNKNQFFLNPASDTKSMACLLRGFDTGIEEIKKGKQSPEDAFSFLPEEIQKDILNDLEQNVRKKIQDGSHIMLEIGNYQFELSLEDDEIVAEKIMLDHGNSTELFELSDESDGTQRLFDLVPLYEYGQKDRVIIIDELDRSFHSKLTQEYVQRFFEITYGTPSQLICTTHDLNLMNLKIIRQDEIWFVEREGDHSSKIYSLSDYKQRFDKNILSEYLIGRYGAIPCFQDLDCGEDSE